MPPCFLFPAKCGDEVVLLKTTEILLAPLCLDRHVPPLMSTAVGSSPYGQAQALGSRDSQEDRAVVVPDIGSFLGMPHVANVGFFAVFDGHMGYSAAEFAQNHLLKNIVSHPYWNESG